jgi:hypothetical protein
MNVSAAQLQGRLRQEDHLSPGIQGGLGHTARPDQHTIIFAYILIYGNIAFFMIFKLRV